MPDLLDGLGFELVSVIVVLLELLESVEDLGLQFVAVDYHGDVLVLDPSVVGFKGVIVPLVYGRSHSVVTALFHSQGEASQLLVTFVVKLAIVLNFKESGLLSFFDHDVEGGVKFLEDNQLDLPAIVALDVSLSEGNILDGFIISYG